MPYKPVLIPGQRYTVQMKAYEMSGWFTAVFVGIEIDASGDAVAVWDNGVHLELWGLAENFWYTDDMDGNWGWKPQPAT